MAKQKALNLVEPVQLRLLTPEMEPRRKEELDQWFTDPELAEEFIEWSGISESDTVLEPTCGSGNLLKPILKRSKKVTGIEIDPEWASYCENHFEDADILCSDFLDLEPPKKKFDVCPMNPPLSDGLDGVFLSRIGLFWAERTCAIVQTRTFHSGERRRTLWNLVEVTRVEFISDRPSFGRGSPMRDFSFVEIRPRPDGLARARGQRDKASIGFY
jgi:predicted RNA methylase